jgi:hypothetical protein
MNKKNRESSSHHLQLVAEVYDECVWPGVYGDPPIAILEYLETGNFGVLEEDGEGVGVSVLRQAVGEVRLRALWVVVYGHVLLLLAQHLLDVVLLEAEAEGNHAEEPEPEQADLAAVRADNLPVQTCDRKRTESVSG